MLPDVARGSLFLPVYLLLYTAFYAVYSFFYSASRTIESLLRCFTSILVGNFQQKYRFISIIGLESSLTIGSEMHFLRFLTFKRK